ncbi:cytochrome c oxidase copper chaperone-like isoform X1 [Acipenser oxyrinchus oxyrinchus]|uniref:Cytochrome c oxidase copper chaperone-like isoform X1 n=1 Tax=Acipenser oxyrinchus oxyrinchus TaxID=40147 RepID=A0AAD8G7R9_ACIOX|nr:cytochrome c oxidase copper chaperone-like isoform X1 [Acipenser oxyrinchus oxyrinchus]
MDLDKQYIITPKRKMSSLAAGSCESTKTQDAGEHPEKKPLKPCCACPETKKIRDACIIEKGEESCKDLIEAHKDCMSVFVCVPAGWVAVRFWDYLLK